MEAMVDLTNSDDDEECIILNRSPSPAPKFSDHQPSSSASGRAALPEKDLEDPPLIEEQLEVLRQVRTGQNIFLTGPAGTGKSVSLRHIIRDLQQRGKRVAILAPTGIAADNVGGTTVHSWAGCGVPERPQDFGRMWENASKHRIRDTDCVVIDEISMLSGEMLDYLESTVSAIRIGDGSAASERPFGGIQLVLSGDFLQLPPIENRKPGGNTRFGPLDAFLNRGFAFQAEAWKKCEIKTMELEAVHRQGGDEEFVRALASLRRGVTTQAAEAILLDCHPSNRTHLHGGGVLPTKLHSRNQEVDIVNQGELAALQEDYMEADAEDDVVPDPTLSDANKASAVPVLWRDAFFKQCRAVKKLKLKVGAQVMLLWNVDLESEQKLVNGSRGVVSKLVEVEPEEEADEHDMKGFASPSSRKRNREDEAGCVKTMTLPVVRFANGREQVIFPREFVATRLGVGVCKRKQVPLALAWSISIHKSQGMSIDSLHVSLENIFANGQAYVALSRARSRNGLIVEGFRASCFRANKTVLDFLEGKEVETWKERAYREAGSVNGT